jgi:hypothetical protein
MVRAREHWVKKSWDHCVMTWIKLRFIAVLVRSFTFLIPATCGINTNITIDLYAERMMMRSQHMVIVDELTYNT